MRLGEQKKLSTNGLRYLILLGIILVMIMVFSVASPQFFGISTLMNVIRQTAALAICSIGMTMVILTGGIDLSAGSIIALAPAVGALAMQGMGENSGAVAVAVVGFLATIVAAVFIGAINGILVGYCRISPFMATLATQFAARGITLKITGANRVVIDSDIYNALGQGVLFRINNAKVPVSIILVVVCFAIAVFIFNRTVFGRKTYAVGGNPVASRASGIKVQQQLVKVYVFAAVTYAIGSIVIAGRAVSAQPLAGDGYEFEIITAVVIGGTSLAGGVGTISGTILGTILVGIITTGLGMVDVQPYVNYCVKGLLILAAVLLDMNLGKLSAKKDARSQLDKQKVQEKETTHVTANNQKVAEMIARDEQVSLKLENITKTFPGVKALDDVSLEIKRGKVHALMGENGAGKSTLMKVLSGVYQKDGGQITVNGTPVEIHSPVDSVNLGIAVIYQELAMVPELPITQNIFIGKELMGRSKVFLDLQKMSARATELLGRFGLHINVNKRAKEYTVGQLQMVEIAKAIDSNAWVVVMDEPTAAITEADKERLFEIINELKQKNIAIVYISHRLSEIFEIADEVSILRDGRLVSTESIDNVTEASLIKNMVGHAVIDIFDREKTTSDDHDVVLEVRNLYRKGVFEPISFKVRAGEVLGFSGLIGAGRTEIMRCIFGLDKADGGEVFLNGQKVSIHNPMDAIQAGICLVSEDRRKEGIIPAMSVRENISLPSLGWISKLGVIDRKQDSEMCSEYISSLRIRTPHSEQHIGNLSGGNQQKCCLAKWLARSPKLIILDEPTRGIDVGAKAEIHNLIDSLTKQGMAVVMISSELPEIIGASDRIIVLYEGRKTAELNCMSDTVTQERLMEAASGIEVSA